MNQPSAAAISKAQFASWDPSPDQVAAQAGVMAWWAQGKKREPMLSVGGFAGTGKTSLVGQLARDLQAAGVRIAFATYTGKASQVLTASLASAGVSPEYVGTIHRLLYRPKFDHTNGRVIGWSRLPSLAFDLLIVDEASMVPAEVLKDLLRYRIPLLVVGDHGQLPPVGEDATVMANPTHRLETIHRQARGNPIIELSRMVREGARLDEMERLAEGDTSGKVLWFAGYDGIYEALEFAEPPGLIISYTNRLRVQANRLARSRLKRRGGPVVGEIVLCVRNAYLPSGLLANGARATVLEVKHEVRNHYDLVIDTGDREAFELRISKHQFDRAHTFAGFDEIPGNPPSWEDAGVLMDYGYALTCHRAQGSQADRVAVLFEAALQKMEPDEYRRWAYTAVSRAGDQLMMVTDLG